MIFPAHWLVYEQMLRQVVFPGKALVRTKFAQVCSMSWIGMSAVTSLSALYGCDGEAGASFSRLWAVQASL